MAMDKYGIDYAAVQALLASGECKTEEEAMEKVASGKAQPISLDFDHHKAQVAAFGNRNKEKLDGKEDK